MATDLDRLGGAIGYLLAHGMNGMAAEVQNAIAELRELRSHPPAPQWGLIDTVPRDGIKVLCWLGGDISTAGYTKDFRGRPVLGNRGWHYAAWGMPTHWMPMPEGPGETVSQATEDTTHGR